MLYIIILQETWVLRNAIVGVKSVENFKLVTDRSD